MHMKISFSDFWGFACNEYLIKVDHKRGKTNIRGDSELQIPNYAFYVNIQIIMYTDDNEKLHNFIDRGPLP